MSFLSSLKLNVPSHSGEAKPPATPLTLPRGARILLTGATGFVGKCVLEKIVREFGDDDVEVYVLIRAKAGVSASSRLEDELFTSPIFNRLRSERFSRPGGGDEANLTTDETSFRGWMRGRVFAVQGDVEISNLGLADDQIARLAHTINLVIHCAASIDFDERLDRAFVQNVEGSINMLELCDRRLPKVSRLVQVSTSYVAANQPSKSRIPEALPKLEFDYAALMHDVGVVARQSQGPELESKMQELKLKALRASGYPNTYTLTKAVSEIKLAERFLSCRPTLALHIVRPSIVGAAWREPFPGWVDAVTAASAVFLVGSLGIVTILPGDPRGVGDVIPVDLCANHIILAACLSAPVNQKPALVITHSATSTENPVKWRVVIDSVVRGFLAREPEARLSIGSRKGFKMIKDPVAFQLEWAACYGAPSKILSSVAMVTGNPSHEKLAKLMNMLNERAWGISGLFSHFTLNEFFFESGGAATLFAPLPNPKLNIDAKDVAWDQYFDNYTYGLVRFVLHENFIPVSEATVTHNSLKLTAERLVEWDADHHAVSFPGLLPDISWAYTSGRAPGYTESGGGWLGRIMGLTGWKEGKAHEAEYVPRKTTRAPSKTKRLVLDSAAVRHAIHTASVKNPKSSIAKERAKAESVYARMASVLVDQPPRSFAWMLRKLWRRLFDGIHVHEKGMEQLRAAVSRNNDVQTPSERVAIVLVPSHRSYIDFLVLSYVMFAFNVPVPYIGASEDFLGMGPISSLLRQSGAFFLKRGGESAMSEDPTYRAVLAEYLHRLALDGQVVEFFVEGTRSRTGKALDPKVGMLNIYADMIASKRIKDVVFIPVAVDYERPLEVSLFAEEMLGSSKPPETLPNLLRAAFTSATGRSGEFGRLNIQFADHISMKDHLSRSGETTRSLGVRIVQEISNASVCFATHMVATLLLMYRHGATKEQLTRSLDWLRREIARRGGKVAGVEGERIKDVVTRAVRLLGPLVLKRDSPAVYQAEVKRDSWANYLSLAYYRNHLSHLFVDEAMWCVSIFAAEKSSATPTNASSMTLELSAEGLPVLLRKRGAATKRARIDSDVRLLHSLLSREFIGRSRVGAERALVDLLSRGVLTEDPVNGELAVAASRPFALLVSIVWPALDAYFVAASALFALIDEKATLAIPQAELVARMLVLGEALFQDGVVTHYESCSLSALQNAVALFQSWGVIASVQASLPKLPMQPLKYRKEVQLCPAFASRAAVGALVERIDALRKSSGGVMSGDGVVIGQGGAIAVAIHPGLARM